MKFERGVSQIPTGSGAEIEANKETLPAVQVKNKVLWVNKDIDFPFDLKEEESTNLGLFLTSSPLKEDKVQKLQTDSRHHRSALLGRVVFKDTDVSESQLFRDVDIKGAGYVALFFDVGDIFKKSQTESFGILNYNDAYHDMGLSETLHDLGVRTHRVIAIIELEEIISAGKKYSIEEAKKAGLISEQSRPVLEVRAFGTNHRLLDVFAPETSRTERKALINDARMLVAQELGKDPEKFNNLDYVNWLAVTLGKNMALMHKNGYTHKYLSEGHNITLDGCLVDFDSVKSDASQSDEDIKIDYDEAGIALAAFLEDGMELEPLEAKKVYEQYELSYQKNIK